MLSEYEGLLGDDARDFLAVADERTERSVLAIVPIDEAHKRYGF